MDRKRPRLHHSMDQLPLERAQAIEQRNLHKHRAAQLVRERHNWRSGAYKLPDELLSDVFTAVVGDEHGACTQDLVLQLCSISRRIRKIVRATKSLWTLVQFPLCHAGHRFAKDALFLELSGEAEVTVDIDWATADNGFRTDEIGDWDVFPITRGQTMRVALMLAPHMSRVRSFVFACQVYAPIAAFFHALAGTPAPRLQHLELLRPVDYIDYQPKNAPHLFDDLLPALKFARFDGIYFNWKHVRLSGLTVLVLKDLLPATRPTLSWLGKTLSASPQIEILELDENSIRTRPGEEPEQFPLCVLPCLRRVSLSRVETNVLAPLVSCLKAPNLDMLDVYQLDDEALVHALTIFENVQSLRLAFCHENTSDGQLLFNSLAELPSLQRLEISHYGAANSLLETIMRANSQTELGWSSPPVLPHLHEMCLYLGLEACEDVVRAFVRHRVLLGVPLDAIEFCEWTSDDTDIIPSSQDRALVKLDGRTGEEIIRRALVKQADELGWPHDLLDEMDSEIEEIDMDEQTVVEQPDDADAYGVDESLGLIDDLDEDLDVSDDDEHYEGFNMLKVAQYYHSKVAPQPSSSVLATKAQQVFKPSPSPIPKSPVRSCAPMVEAEPEPLPVRMHMLPRALRTLFRRHAAKNTFSRDAVMVPLSRTAQASTSHPPPLLTANPTHPSPTLPAAPLLTSPSLPHLPSSTTPSWHVADDWPSMTFADSE